MVVFFRRRSMTHIQRVVLAVVVLFFFSAAGFLRAQAIDPDPAAKKFLDEAEKWRALADWYYQYAAGVSAKSDQVRAQAAQIEFDLGKKAQKHGDWCTGRDRYANAFNFHVGGENYYEAMKAAEQRCSVDEAKKKKIVRIE
jgi:hypothetical protein